VFQDLSTGRRIGSGHERGGMYYLDDRVTPNGLLAGQHDTAVLLHWRLSHPFMQKLRSVVPVESSFSTLGCELGKYHRVIYHLSESCQ